MEEMSGMTLYLFLSTTILWIAVLCLLGMKLQEIFKKQGMKALVMDDSGRVRDELTLGKQKEILIGKSTPDNLVNIDFGGSQYAETIEPEHAALKQFNGCWYVCSEAENGMVGLKQSGDDTVYKLKPGIPYQIHSGDIVYISYEKIVIQ